MTKRLYAGNLPFETTEEEVRRLFAPFGEVHGVDMITDRDSGRFRGFCFVEMEEEEADAAIAALDGKKFGGRKMRVNEARPRSGSGEKGRGKKKGRKDDRPLHERTSRGGAGAQGDFPHSGGSRGQGRSQGRGGDNDDSDFPFSGGGSRRNR
ncbi:MAG: hypothetical protein R3248_03750 [Candidatus Promineifilaceae bacterium]|nr:hypothetical protein [Candidatus Promineifilaceae bacterium]